jgi:lysophospholipase L1-like esterase
MLDLPTHFGSRVAQFERECARLGGGGAGREGVVFLGDSLVEYYKGPLHWVNRGICSDHLHWPVVNIFERLGRDRLHPDPRAIVTLVGINDLNDAPDAVEAHVTAYRLLLGTLAQLYPQCTLAVCSLLPTRGVYAHLNPRIEAFNRRLADAAESTGARFFDLHARFMDPATGMARAGWVVADGLHLSRRGYAELTAYAEARAADLGDPSFRGRTFLSGFARVWRGISAD